MRSFGILIIVIFSFTNLRAQTFFDQLQHDLKTAKDDTSRILALYNLADYYAWSNVDSSFQLANEVVRLSKKNNYFIGQYLGTRVMVFATVATGNYPRAHEYALRKLQLFEAYKGEKESIRWTIPHDFSVLYRAMGNLDSSVAEARKMNHMLDELERTHQKVLRQVEFDLVSQYSAIGQYYFIMQRFDSSIWYLRKAYQISLSGIDKRRLPLTAALFANVHEAVRNFDSANKYYRIGIEASNFYGTVYFRTRLYNNIAGLFQKLGRLDSTIYFAELALQMAQKNKYGDYAATASKTLASVFNSRSQPDSELKYIKIMLAAKDTIFSQAKLQQFSMQVVREQQRRMGIDAEREKYRSNMRLYSSFAAIAVFLLLSFILYLNNRSKRRANILLNEQKTEIDIQRDKAECALKDLKATQAQLIQSEKMASLGEMTAGVAHEIQNPLNFVNNFSELNMELIEELKTEQRKPSSEKNEKLETELLNSLQQNLEKINHHGKRADSIVKGMLQHSQGAASHKEPTNINALTDEYLKMTYHGFRSKEKSFTAKIVTDFDQDLEKVNIVPQDISRVLLNLFNNAFYALNEKLKKSENGFEPTVAIRTREIAGSLEIRIADNGNGIPNNIAEKVFQPFFTTKPTGQGTGLGLSLAYEIITKGHGGELKFETKEGVGTAFIIHLPIVS